MFIFVGNIRNINKENNVGSILINNNNYLEKY